MVHEDQQIWYFLIINIDKYRNQINIEIEYDKLIVTKGINDISEEKWIISENRFLKNKESVEIDFRCGHRSLAIVHRERPYVAHAKFVFNRAFNLNYARPSNSSIMYTTSYLLIPHLFLFFLQLGHFLYSYECYISGMFICLLHLAFLYRVYLCINTCLCTNEWGTVK